MSPPSSPACPMCRRAATPENAPFCSPRCKDRDLLQWLGGGYAIPGDALDDEALDKFDAPD